MKPAKLIIGFENCESVVVPIKYITSFSIGGIAKSICYTGVKGDGVVETTTANRIYILFNGSFAVSKIMTTFDEEAYRRIPQHADITHIDVEYETGHIQTYAVEWAHDDSYSNSRQSCTYHYDGMMLEIYP